MPSSRTRFGLSLAAPFVVALSVTAFASPVLAAGEASSAAGHPLSPQNDPTVAKWAQEHAQQLKQARQGGARPGQLSPKDATIVKRAGEQEQRRRKDQSLGAKAKRRASRDRYRHASRADSIALGRRFFPEAFAKPLFDGKQVAPDVDVVDYRATGTAIVKNDDGKRFLLQSTVPLRAPTENGAMAPVDLTLMQSQNTFTTANSNANLQISQDAEKGTELQDAHVTIAPQTTQDATGTETDGRVVYYETQTDTDFLVAPTATGGEFSWLLRSSDAPERLVLNVDMPDGAVLRRAHSDNPIPGDPPKSLEISKDGKSLPRPSRSSSIARHRP